jgi:chemotaxis protein CheX
MKQHEGMNSAAAAPPAISGQDLVEMMQNATLEVFSTMLGTDAKPGEIRREATEPGPQDGVVALVGLAGSWVGAGMFRCKADTACAVAGLLLMQAYAGVDDEVLDAMGEISNMIFGNVKTALEERVGPLGLSIPTVVFGRNFSTRSVGKNEWTVIPFRWDRHEVEVYLCINPAQKTSSAFRPLHPLSLAM